jgi:hypothetical protein
MKAVTGHTPGPWRVTYSDDGGFQVGVELHDGAFDVVICVRGSWTHRVKESLANARLIAAAPELLAALKEMREFIRIRFPDDSLASGNWPTVKPLVEKWDAAIAKAEGK